MPNCMGERGGTYVHNGPYVLTARVIQREMQRRRVGLKTVDGEGDEREPMGREERERERERERSLT